MQEVSFKNIPETSEQMINQISNNVLRQIFAKFKYLYFSFKEIIKKPEEYTKYDIYIDFLFNYLKDKKLIVYDIKRAINNTSLIENNLNSNIYDLIICFEGECLIVENMLISIIEKLISLLKNNHISLINVSYNINFNDNNFEIKEQEAKEEIKNFCLQFSQDINKNEIVKYLINPLVGYLIRRYFYPSDYFKDDSFFVFGEPIKSEEKQIKSKIFEFLNKTDDKTDAPNMLSIITSVLSYKDNYINNQNKIYDFNENEFVILRNVYNNRTSSFYLVLHLKSLYIFMMKLDHGGDIDHEIDFCSKYSHRCLTRFYGFLKKNQTIIGFIYEFQSNGSLLHYSEIDEFYCIIVIARLFEVIEYFHSNSLIHRDLSPSNILINHDNLPYISDFETIRQLEKNQDFLPDYNLTNNIGSSFYSSPELDIGQKVSYKTDIYSFGLIIYFLFNKENMWKSFCSDKSCKIKPITKCSQNIQTLYNKCVVYDQYKRITIDEIRNILNLEFNSFNYLEEYLLKSTSNNLIILEFLMEKMLIPTEQKTLINCFEHILLFRKLFLNIKDNNMQLFYLNLGECYRNGKGVMQDYLKAKNYYEKSAQLNNSYAINVLGYMYDHGLGVKQDYSKAKEYYEKSAQLNDSFAFNNLGFMFEHGLGVNQNYSKAIEYYEKSALLNNPYGLGNLGQFYLDGQIVKQDYSKAKEYFERAAQLNHPTALIRLGNIYEDGLGVKKDFLKAFEYYEKSAILGSPEAFNFLGVIYEYGRGVKQDYAKAKKYYEISAQFGCGEAFNNLGMLYEHGRGVKQDFMKAKELYEKYPKGIGLCNLGFLYENGKGVEKDYLKAKKYYEKSAEQNCPNAFYFLGILYEKGLGVEQDYLIAKEYYEKSAQLNHSQAFNKLGSLYLNGKGVKQNYIKAKEYFEKSSLKNNTEAFSQLGYMYDHGIGVQRNLLTAKQYYEKASQYDDPYSIYRLGVFYSNGDFFDININKAVKYFIKSINIQRGNKPIYKEKEKSYSLCFVSNLYRYISYNCLGLIYLIFLDDLEKAEKYIKESAFNEFPFGQNNFGLFNQFYLNKIEYAEYMYERSAKSNFSLAEYNLGYLHEQKNDIKGSIQYYIQASEHEDEELIYRNIHVFDKKLEISKAFIICFTNLKLVDYYFSLGKYDESKKFFYRAINKLLKKNEKYSIEYIFQFTFQSNNTSRLFSYLRTFFLNCSLFNLNNQPDLNISIIFNNKHQNDIIEKCTKINKKHSKIDNKENLSEIETKMLQINEVNGTDKNKKMKLIENKNQQRIEDMNISCKFIDYNRINCDLNDIIFNNPDDLFDFIMKYSNPVINLKQIFIKEIREIINIMKIIMYKPPYSILFGRIFIEKQNKSTEKNINDQHEDLNENFYAGFESN